MHTMGLCTAVTRNEPLVGTETGVNVKINVISKRMPREDINDYIYMMFYKISKIL